MVEADVYLYLKSNTPLVAIIDTNSIYTMQAPSTGIKMPWLIVEQTSGMRKRISMTKTEETAFIRITVDVGPQDKVKGRNIAEAALRALENYRGTLQTSRDVIATCSAVRGYAGYSECYRYQFDTTVKTLEDTTYPN